MTAARMVARLAGPCCGVRSEPDPLALARARCAEPSDGLDGALARLWGRLFDIVDEYLREDRPQ